MVKTIEIQEALKLAKTENIIFVDTRSPKEFEEDNIYDSINIPIFSNDERAFIGTLYKYNQVEAYQKGFEVYNKKILDFIKQFQNLPESATIIIYCWRGGMRSKTIAELVTNLGRKTYQLVGGYKQFRKYIIECFENYETKFELLSLQGMAGSGKTDLLRKLTPMIDLEGLAQHRSSLFGALGLHKKSQKYFESRLWQQILEHKENDIVFIEGEARKIGDIHIPEKFFAHMQAAKTILVKASIDSRSKRIVKDYFTHGEDEQIKKIILKLKEQLSKKVAEELCELVDAKEYAQVAEVLLVDYYDHQYNHALTEQKYIAEVCSDNVEKGVEGLNRIREGLL